jgi:hypothetical protein
MYNKSPKSVSHVQKTDGSAPSGFTATEFQEWFRLKALPAMQECADRCFVRKPADSNHWFTAALQASYEKLETATDFNHRYHKKFLISHDQDSRHSYKHYPLTSGGHKGKPTDRRSIAKGKPLHIGVHEKKDYVPTAPRVPDCIQSTFEVVVQQALEAFREKGGADRASRCWQHAVQKSIRIFATPYKTWITIGEDRVMGVGGNWVPKKYSG